MIENEFLHRYKNYIFLKLNVASVGKGLSEDKYLYEKFVDKVKDMLRTPAYKAFSSKSAEKTVNKSINVEFLSVENALKEVWWELNGMRLI